MRKMDRFGNIPYEPTKEEDINDYNRLSIEESNLGAKITANSIYLVISWAVLAAIAYIVKVNFTPAFDIVKLCTMGGFITAIKFGGEAIISYNDLKKVKNEIEGIKTHLNELEQRKTEVPERVITEREYEELLAEKNGYVRGEDPQYDKVHDYWFNEREKARQEGLERTRKAKGIKPVSDSLIDEAITEMDDGLEPPEFMNTRKGR